MSNAWSRRRHRLDRPAVCKGSYMFTCDVTPKIIELTSGDFWDVDMWASDRNAEPGDTIHVHRGKNQLLEVYDADFQNNTHWQDTFQVFGDPGDYPFTFTFTNAKMTDFCVKTVVVRLIP